MHTACPAALLLNSDDCRSEVLVSLALVSSPLGFFGPGYCAKTKRPEALVDQNVPLYRVSQAEDLHVIPELESQRCKLLQTLQAASCAFLFTRKWTYNLRSMSRGTFYV